MKKIIFGITAVVLSAVLLFAGCAQKTKFSFHAYWTGQDSYPENFSERSVFSVKHITDYKRETADNTSDDFSAQENSAFSVSFDEGEYVFEVTSVSSLPQELGIEIGDYTDLYKIETSFRIGVTYTVTATEKSYTFEDTIQSIAYCKSTWLAPIYSYKTYATTTLNGSASDVKIQRMAYSTEINWYAEKGALLKKIPAEKPVTEYDEDPAYRFTTVESEEISVSYEEGTVLDNETLFFAVRGLKPTGDSFSQTLNILDTAYNSEQPVSVASSRSYSFENDWLFTNGSGVTTEITEPMPVCLVTIWRGDATYSGSAKHCYYQLESDKTVPYRALFVRMVDKLPNNLGALDYTLKSLTTSEA